MFVPRERLELEEREGSAGPPWLDRLYACAPVVVVHGFAAHALLDIEVDGSVEIDQADGGFPEPQGAVLQLPNPLHGGQRVRARQHVDGVASEWSPEVEVIEHRVDYPAGPPRPQVNPAPVYECGRRTGVSNLLAGSNVWITADSAEVGRVDGAATHQGVNVEPPYGLGQEVIAWSSLCDDPSPPSQTHVSQDGPYPLSTPEIQPVYESTEQIVIDGLANGCTFTLSRAGTPLGDARAWGGRFLYPVSPAAASGETWSVTQRLCPGPGGSPPGTTTTRPCSELPPPRLAPVGAGATSVTLLEHVAGSRVKVFAGSEQVGDGTGPVVTLSRSVTFGEQVAAYQVLGSCVSDDADVVTVQCFAPPVGAPAHTLDLFPVGHTTYDGGSVDALGFSVPVRGSVYYPADADGDATPFNRRLADLGPVPIVFMVHGNHWWGDPNHLGYDYFQQHLARMGIIAVSVDENELNGGGPSASDDIANIERRALVFVASMEHFGTLSSSGHEIFGDRVDLNRIGIMGHSRGGEAVMRVPELPLPAGTHIRAVLSLAPVDFGATAGPPGDYEFMTLLPAADGDVAENDGAKFYDRATSGPYRCQVYVDHANHNFFNRAWLNDDTGGAVTVLPRHQHEHILLAYGCALFRRSLLGHDVLAHLDGGLIPWGVDPAVAHVSFTTRDAQLVDDHEQPGGIGTNTLGAPTQQLDGLQADEYPFTQSGGAFNATFFGATSGMVAERTGRHRSELAQAVDLRGREIRIRTGEVSGGGANPPQGVRFDLGVETTHGQEIWVASDAVGGIPRPYVRGFSWSPTTKTMPSTLRFPWSCFFGPDVGQRPPEIQAILLRIEGEREQERPLCFDDLEMV